jgi:hypothetical protein
VYLRPSFPRRRINPFLLRHLQRRYPRAQKRVARISGFTHYMTFYHTLREEKVTASPLTIARLQRVAAAIGFSKDEIFLD